MALLDLTEEKKEDIFKQFKLRFNSLKRLREPLDEIVRDYQKVFDYDFEEKKAGTIEVPSGYNYGIPYAYTIIMTMLAFTKATLFGMGKDVVTIDIEDYIKGVKGKNIENYVNSILEQCKFKEKAYSFLLNAYVDPISWVQLVPITEGKHFTVDIQTLNFFDVYFDTKAKTVMGTDFMVRTIQGHLDLYNNNKHYYPEDVEDLKNSDPPQDVIQWEKERYKDERKGINNTKASYYHPTIINNNDDVEVLTWYTRYDIDGDGKLVDIIVGIGNRKNIIRVEKNPMQTKRKALVFPVVANKLANSLMGSSTIAPIQDTQDLLNESISLRQTHFRLLVKLLFKYNKNSDIDTAELFADGGNAIAFDGDPDDVGIFPVQNMLRECSAMIQEQLQFMQQITGATDYLMGTSVGRGITETARGVSIITQNAMQKFNLIIDNLKPDVIEIIKYIVILFNKQSPNRKRVKYFKVKEFVSMEESDIEEDFRYDLVLKNQAQDTDRERAQFINAVNIFGQMLTQLGGDSKALIKKALEKFDLKTRDIEEIMGETPEAQAKVKKSMGFMEKLITKGIGGMGGSSMANSQARQTETANQEQEGGAGGT